jgi:hypothetical protein
MTLQKSLTQGNTDGNFFDASLKADINRSDISNDILSKYGGILADIGYTYHTTVSLTRFWLNGFTLREKLHQSLMEAFNKAEQNNRQSICWQQHLDLRDEIKTNCTKFLSHFQSEYAPDCHNEMQQLSDQCFGDKSHEVDTTKMSELLKKMDKEMTKQFESSLWQQVYGAAFSLIAMGITLRKTCAQIKSSQTYHDSDKLRLSIQRIEEYLQESDVYIKAYNVPIHQLTGLVSTQQSYSAALNDLKYGKRSLNFAKRELNVILLEVETHSKSIEQSRDNHVSGIANNTIRLIGHGVQFMETPASILTSTALSLYGFVTGIEITTIAGHALGVYWSQEEINKLNELRHEMNEFEEKINEIFSTITRIEEKIANIKEEENIH